MIRNLVLAISSILVGVGLLWNVDAPAQEEVHAKQAMMIDGVIQGGNLLAVQSAILEKKSGDSVDLIINSPGGSVISGFIFISAMEAAKSRGVTIHCFVPNVAASMAFQILLHCNTRTVLSRSFLLWHRARVMLGGMFGSPMTAPQLSVMARELDRTDALILDEVRQYVNLPDEELIYHFENETLHIGAQLAAAAPGAFKSALAVPGLYEAMSDRSIPRTKGDSLFDSFRFGELIYIRSTETLRNVDK